MELRSNNLLMDIHEFCLLWALVNHKRHSPLVCVQLALFDINAMKHDKTNAVKLFYTLFYLFSVK